MTLRIYSVWYGARGSPYARMANVLEHTARRFHTHVNVSRRRGDFKGTRSDAFSAKSRDWTELIARGESADVLALLDADTFLQRSLNLICASDFDVAVTVHKDKLNSGVLFVRPSARVNTFFESWPVLTDAWCKRNKPGDIRYGDQDALIEMLAAPHTLKILRLQMHEWNSTQRTWHRDLAKARIVHFKSRAREHVFEGKACNELSLRVANMWRALEKEITHYEYR